MSEIDVKSITKCERCLCENKMAQIVIETLLRNLNQEKKQVAFWKQHAADLHKKSLFDRIFNW